MCENCSNPEANCRPAQPSPELVALAREFDGQLAGDCASDDAWAVFLGRQGGAVPWAEFERIARCLDRAANHWRFKLVRGRMAARPGFVADAPAGGLG